LQRQNPELNWQAFATDYARQNRGYGFWGHVDINDRDRGLFWFCDNAAGWALARGRVDMVVVGADRIASNGDTANKIGTYPLAVLAGRHGVPFHVAAPSTTFDLALADGGSIPIEERAAEEVLAFQGVRSAPEGVGAFNPAFDVTPAELITSIVTEFGVIEKPTDMKIRAHFAGRE